MLLLHCAPDFEQLQEGQQALECLLMLIDASDMSGPEAAELWLNAMISHASEDGSPQTFDTTALSSLQAGHVHGVHRANLQAMASSKLILTIPSFLSVQKT